MELAEIVQQQTMLLKSMQEEIARLSTRTQPDNINVPWPPAINTNKDPEEAFKAFQSSWKDYCRATQMNNWSAQEEPRKVSVLFSAIGEEALKKYGNFGITDSDKEKMSCIHILDIMKLKMVPKKNIIYNRYIFLGRNQSLNEPFDIFYADLSRLIEDCDYDTTTTDSTIKEEMLRDKIVLGIRDIALKKDLLKKDNLTLKEAINLCRAAEATDKHIKEFSTNTNSAPSEIKKIEEKKIRQGKCRFCGNNHIYKKENCPAWGTICTHCKGKNHLEKVCKKKKQVKELKQEQTCADSSSDSEPDYFINKIVDDLHSANKNLAECQLEFKHKKEWKKSNCLLDTAADACIIGLQNVEKMLGKSYVQERMRPSKKTLFGFGGNNIMVHGEIDLIIKTNISGVKNKYNVTFQVVHIPHIPLLSCKACTLMGLVKFCKELRCESQDTQDLMQNYSSVFEGHGSFSGELELEIDETVSPVIQKARRVPVALWPVLKEELQRLEKEGIITKEDNHTDWVSNILLIKKKDSFRICLDPIPLNKAIKRPNHQFTTVEEILPELGKAKIFSTFDVKKGFWHLNLTEHSSKLTTFWTPFAKYRWKVLPFGISSAPDYFQIKMNEMIQGLTGVEALVDDLLVYGVGDTMSEAIMDHNKNLEALFKTLVKHNCKLNKSKTKLLQTSVKYYGHIFTNQGLQPDPSKIESISNIPEPKNKKELQRFLGVVTYLSRFIPNLSAESTSLRQLTHDNSEWIWSKKAQKEFATLKHIISDIKTLKYYDKNEPLVIECDSSEGALGVALFQHNEPVAYASRCLTPTEKKYAQIEKELLSVVFACTRFDQLIIGNTKTIIKTDHKPLLNIFKKPLLHAPKRLQSMLLTLQRYSLELQFISGKENIMADALSRFYLDCKDIDKSKDFKIFEIIEKINPLQNVPISDYGVNDIANATAKDSNLMVLKTYIQNGWPKYMRDVPDALKPYCSIKSDLTMHKDLILKGQAILIPESLRQKMLHKLHKAHSGIENTLKLARDTVFWLSMSKDIKELINSCSTCSKYQPSQQKFTMQCNKIPEYPFQIISMDVFFFTHKGKQSKYLILVDHYSDFFEIEKLKDLSSKPVIEACKKNFSRHGTPEIVITDGGTNFVNQDFADFAKEWQFTHVTSSPNHPQGNGKAEATVKIAKKLLQKSTENEEDFWLSLLCLRNTPNKLNSSPAQRLFSRRTRGFLPVINALLKPDIVEHVPEDIQRKKEIVKQSYDKRARIACPLEIGQAVSVQMNPSSNKKWTPGVVSDILSDRSYLVDVNDATYRRDLIHIRPRLLNSGGPSELEVQHNSDIQPGKSFTNLHQENVSVGLTQNDVTCPTSSTIEPTLNLMANEEQYSSPKPSMLSTDSSCLRSPVPNTKESRPRREIKTPSYLKDYVT